MIRENGTPGKTSLTATTVARHFQTPTGAKASDVCRRTSSGPITRVLALVFAAASVTAPPLVSHAETTADSIAVQVVAAEKRLRSGDQAGARAQLDRLIHQPPLAGKIAEYARLADSLDDAPGTPPYRKALVHAGIPALSHDELRALHLFSMLPHPGVRTQACDDDERERLLYLAALGGDPASQFQVGQLLAAGSACWKANAEESVHWYATAAAQNHPEAAVNLAVARFLGQGVARNPGQAVQLLTAAAANRNPRAQYLLGVLHAAGDGGVRKSQRKAIGFLRAAAEQGFVPAQTSLGQILWERAVSLEEWDEARQWLLKAAKQGDTEAQYRLGRTYISGIDGDFWRFGESLKWLQQAAEGGHLQAQAALALQYWSGDIRTGTMQANHGKAVHWLRIAAARGNSRAQTYLGYAYAKGSGVPQDRAAALAWWRKAAAQNDARAEEALGHAYENGLGVAKDVATARTWYMRARSHGSAGARQALRGSEFERLARDENQIFAAAAFFGAIIAAGIAERTARAERIESMLAAGSEWKSKYFCGQELWERPKAYGTPDMFDRTICYERNGAFRYADGLLDPCNGVKGWCDGFGFSPD